MSADKHRRLALEVAYLRLASRETGISLNIKWGWGITPLIERMIDAGDLVRRRVSMGGRKNVTCVYATAQGLAKMTQALTRFGSGFGPISGLGRIEPVRLRKDVVRLRARPPEQIRAQAQAAKARARANALKARAWMLAARANANAA